MSRSRSRPPRDGEARACGANQTLLVPVRGGIAGTARAAVRRRPRQCPARRERGARQEPLCETSLAQTLRAFLGRGGRHERASPAATGTATGDTASRPGSGRRAAHEPGPPPTRAAAHTRVPIPAGRRAGPVPSPRRRSNWQWWVPSDRSAVRSGGAPVGAWRSGRAADSGATAATFARWSAVSPKGRRRARWRAQRHRRLGLGLGVLAGRRQGRRPR